MQLIALNNEQAPELVNRNMLRLDVGANFLVIKSDSTAFGSVSSPTQGDAYIIPTSGNTGSWSTFSAKDIAFYDGNNWFKISPTEGQQAFIQSNDTFKYYNGTNWVATPTSATSILGLNDVNETSLGTSGQVLAVNAGGDAMEFADASGATTFLGLTDTPNPANYSGQANRFIMVNSAPDALVFSDDNTVFTSFVKLSDTPESITNGQFLKGNTGTSPDTIVFGTVSMGDLDEAKTGFSVPSSAGRYLQTDGTSAKFEFDVIPVADLSDGPGAPTSSSHSGKFIRVASSGDSLEYATITPGSGSTTFVGLTDAPDTIVNDQILIGNTDTDPDTLEFVSHTFLRLADTPLNYSSANNKILKVNNGGDAVQFGANILDLDDCPNTMGSNGQVLKVNAGALVFADDATGSGGSNPAWNDITNAEDFAANKILHRVKTNDPGGGATTPTQIELVDDTFLTINDTPDNYTGHGAKILRVNGTSGGNGTAVEFQPPNQLGIVLNDLSNVDATTNLANNKILKYNSSASQWQVQDDTGTSGGVDQFHELIDTPSAVGTDQGYDGHAAKYLRVNIGDGTDGTAIEFIEHHEIKDIYVEYLANGSTEVILKIPYAFDIISAEARVTTSVTGTVQIYTTDNSQSARDPVSASSAASFTSASNIVTFTLNSGATNQAANRGIRLVFAGFNAASRDFQMMMKIRRR